VRKKNIERKPASAMSWVTLAAASPRTRKIESGTRGFLLRCSLITKAVSSARAPRSSPIVRAVPQP
jgi:hypothetical protein